MEKNLKAIALLCLVFVVVKFWLLREPEPAPFVDPGPPQPSAAAAAALAAGSARGFTPLPAPFISPPEPLLVYAPLHCSPGAQARTNAIMRALSHDHIHYLRGVNPAFPFTRDPTDDETAQFNQIMQGQLPVVFVNGRFRDNPTVAEIEAEVRNSRR